MEKTAYKLVRKDGDKIKALFHGVDGSREFPMNEWVKADKKWVKDGTNGTYYTSGFHVLFTYDECLAYLNNFETVKDKAIVKCEIGDNVWEKEHSRDDVHLTDFMKITEVYHEL